MEGCFIYWMKYAANPVLLALDLFVHAYPCESMVMHTMFTRAIRARVILRSAKALELKFSSWNIIKFEIFENCWCVMALLWPPGM